MYFYLVTATVVISYVPNYVPYVYTGKCNNIVPNRFSRYTLREKKGGLNVLGQ